MPRPSSKAPRASFRWTAIPPTSARPSRTAREPAPARLLLGVVRRKLREVYDQDKSEIATEGLAHIAQLYRIEAETRGCSAAKRPAQRQALSAQLVEDFGRWLAYIARHWDHLLIFLTDGSVEIDSNPSENCTRPLALNLKSTLFVGHDEGGWTWSRIASLIETANMNGLDPFTFLKATLEAIACG